MLEQSKPSLLYRMVRLPLLPAWRSLHPVCPTQIRTTISTTCSGANFAVFAACDTVNLVYEAATVGPKLVMNAHLVIGGMLSADLSPFAAAAVTAWLLRATYVPVYSAPDRSHFFSSRRS